MMNYETIDGLTHRMLVEYCDTDDNESFLKHILQSNFPKERDKGWLFITQYWSKQLTQSGLGNTKAASRISTWECMDDYAIWLRHDLIPLLESGKLILQK